MKKSRRRGIVGNSGSVVQNFEKVLMVGTALRSHQRSAAVIDLALWVEHPPGTNCIFKIRIPLFQSCKWLYRANPQSSHEIAGNASPSGTHSVSSPAPTPL